MASIGALGRADIAALPALHDTAVPERASLFATEMAHLAIFGRGRSKGEIEPISRLCGHFWAISGGDWPVVLLPLYRQDLGASDEAISRHAGIAERGTDIAFGGILSSRAARVAIGRLRPLQMAVRRRLERFHLTYATHREDACTWNYLRMLSEILGSHRDWKPWDC